MLTLMKIHKPLFGFVLARRFAQSTPKFITQVQNYSEIQPMILESKIPVALYITYRALKTNSTLFTGLTNHFAECHGLNSPFSQIENKSSVPLAQLNESNSQNESRSNQATKSKKDKQLKPEDHQWKMLYFEPDDLAAAKKLFNMRKLPCVYLFCYGNIIDFMEGEISSSKIAQFCETIDNLVEKTTGIMSDKGLKELLDKIVKYSFEEKNLKEAERLLQFVEASEAKGEPSASIIRLLKAHVLFQQKEFVKFRSVWSQIEEESIADSANERLIALYKNYCSIWQKNLSDINRAAELEKQVTESSYRNFDQVYELAELMEGVDPEKAISLLLKIVEQDKTWNNSGAVKKAAQIINALKNSTLKISLRKKLAIMIN